MGGVESEARVKGSCPSGREEIKTNRATQTTPGQTHPPKKTGQDNFSSVSSIHPHSQNPTDPIAHSVNLKREGFQGGPQRAQGTAHTRTVKGASQAMKL